MELSLSKQVAHKLWVEKYRPQSIEQYLFHDNTHRGPFMKMIDQKSIPNLLLQGIQGTGKTTLAYILIESTGIDNMDVLELNASDDNNVETVREKIKNFVLSYAMGPFKIILLEEADFLTLQGQAILKKLMEDYVDNVRFILTCNRVHKLMPEIRSRCQEFYFKSPDKDEVTELAATILVQEKVRFTVPLLDKYIAFGYPDIRKIIQLLQQNSVDGVLLDPQQQGTVGDYKFTLVDLIERDKWEEARRLVCANVSTEEWEQLYRFLYEYLDKAPKFTNKSKWEEGIVTIAEHLYKHAVVADPEINAAAMFIKLTKI